MNFDVLAEAYEAMIDWDKRLANEAPLYRRVIEQAGAKSVIDAACGTGRHAAMFAEWGLKTEGADVNAKMIEHCRGRYAGKPDLSFAVRSFLEAATEHADLVVCVGNSLALAGGIAEVNAAIKAMCDSARPGGVVVLHVLNLLSREEGPVRWDKCTRTKLSTGDAMIIKGTHRAGGCGYVDFLLTDLTVAPPRLTADSVRFLALEREHLEAECRRGGCDAVEAYGNYRLDPFDPAASGDLIVVAHKRKIGQMPGCQMPTSGGGG